MSFTKSSPYGLHRVVEPFGVFPQPAKKIDATPTITEDEMLVQVDRLNIDSASFSQIKLACDHDSEKVKEMIQQIIMERGKMHNPVTGSGGMLIGRVINCGAQFPRKVKTGQIIATLVSLTLTPLRVEEILHIDMKTGQVEVRGTAVVFASAPFAVLPADLPQALSLAVLDVCGAPAQTARMVQAEDTVVILGAGGKSGILSLAQAWKKAGMLGKVIAIEANSDMVERLCEMDLAHHVIEADATDPCLIMEKVAEVTGGRMADLTINCVNVPHTELSSILATRDGGMVYFFSMAVQFTAAALGAEGVGKDVQMMIGNGYAPGHAELSLEIVREIGPVRDWFIEKYGEGF